MTAPQKEHCIHEDVCHVMRYGTVCYRKQNLPCCNFRSRPAPLPRLNTQPKGTTCEDCYRFRTEECPYPESNITITRCNSFIIDLEQHDASIRNAARIDELTNLQGFREEEFKRIPFDPIIFLNRENKFISKLIQSLRTQTQEHP
jgi:hypothetical protein